MDVKVREEALTTASAWTEFKWNELAEKMAISETPLLIVDGLTSCGANSRMCLSKLARVQ